MFEDPSAIDSSVGPGSTAILSFEVNSGCCINNNTVVVYLDVEAGAEDQSSEDSLQDPGGNSLEDAFFRFTVKIIKSTFLFILEFPPSCGLHPQKFDVQRNLLFATRRVIVPSKSLFGESTTLGRSMNIYIQAMLNRNWVPCNI